MSEREIILVDEEEALSKEDLRASLYKDFIAQWTPESVPACDEGMRLLMDLAEMSPVL